MVTLEQVQKGVQAFLDSELIPALNGWKKPVVATVAALWLQNFQQTAEQFLSGGVGRSLGVYQDGKLDIDKIYNELVKQFTAPVPVVIPGVGTVTLTRENIDTLYSLITEAK